MIIPESREGRSQYDARHFDRQTHALKSPVRASSHGAMGKIGMMSKKKSSGVAPLAFEGTV